MGDMTVLQKQEIAKGAEAMGAILGRYAKRNSRKVISPLGTLSIWGKLLAVVAAVAMVTGLFMVVFDSSDMVIDRGKIAVVARDTVNVRQSPSTSAAVITKARSGERFYITGSRGTWSRVRTSDGTVSGWIASALLDTRTARTLNLRYEMKGYFTIAMVSLVVIFFALRMKRYEVPVSSGTRGGETLLVNSD